MPAGRPQKEFDKKAFADLIGFGCTQQEICWFFRDKDTGIPANPDTLSRWCTRVYGMNFQEFKKENELMPFKITLRKNQLELSKKSASMAIFLGKNYLGQEDSVSHNLSVDSETRQTVEDLLIGIEDAEDAEETESDEAEAGR